MNAAPKLRHVFRQFINHHLGSRRDSEELVLAADGMWASLMETLSPLLGNVGSRALLRRSLKSTENSLPCYREARTAREDALLEVISACIRQQPMNVARDASMALLSAYIELLIMFIGEGLTWQILQDTWPDIVVIRSEEKHL